jgi:hypothetical protein
MQSKHWKIVTAKTTIAYVKFGSYCTIDSTFTGNKCLLRSILMSYSGAYDFDSCNFNTICTFYFISGVKFYFIILNEGCGIKIMSHVFLFLLLHTICQKSVTAAKGAIALLVSHSVKILLYNISALFRLKLKRNCGFPHGRHVLLPVAQHIHKTRFVHGGR